MAIHELDSFSVVCKEIEKKQLDKFIFLKNVLKRFYQEILKNNFLLCFQIIDNSFTLRSNGGPTTMGHLRVIGRNDIEKRPFGMYVTPNADNKHNCLLTQPFKEVCKNDCG